MLRKLIATITTLVMGLVAYASIHSYIVQGIVIGDQRTGQ
jgi:hypothetical protein